jgi:hypothetical protein
VLDPKVTHITCIGARVATIWKSLLNFSTLAVSVLMAFITSPSGLVEDCAIGSLSLLHEEEFKAMVSQRFRKKSWNSRHHHMQHLWWIYDLHGDRNSKMGRVATLVFHDEDTAFGDF